MKQQYQIGDIVAASDGYYRVVADGRRDMRLQFDCPYITGEIVPTFGTVVSRHERQSETDAQFWARQNDLIDYAATVDAASYRWQ